MKVSLNWVKKFTDIQLPIEELVEKIGAQLGAVEEVVDLGKKYKGIIIAKVVSCEKHPNADKLIVCKMDDGGIAQEIKRDENGYVEVVCGAPNVRAGLLVAWLPPGTVAPSTFDKDPLTLEAREIRGVISNGMLASPHELAISDDHSGILELNPHDAKPGDDFAKIYQLDDYIIDIENKMFTHRPDLFGMLGIAREIAGITGKKFTSPDWYTRDINWKAPESPIALSVSNDLPELVPRFMAVAVNIEHNGPSPLWLQTYLSRSGLRPINMLVDLTNYVMLLSSQPMHAYDYDKVAKLAENGQPQLIVRYPKKGETITLLNGKTIEPTAEAIVIATDKVLLGIGGVMGGREAEVDENTKRVILECANFNMYSVRRTAMANGLFTDAVTRFNKGQSPWQTDRVLGYALALLEQCEVGSWACEVVDNKSDLRSNQTVEVTTDFITSRLGLELSTEAIVTLLENVEFKVEANQSGLTITVPFWRTDIEIPEDIVEEVGRLYGYDKLPLELPRRSLAPAKKDPVIESKSRIRDVLSRSGANELLTYSFVHGNLLDRVGQNKEQAFQLSNALSPDLQYYRLSLTPSLLDKAKPNIKAGHGEFALFEINKIHMRGQQDIQEPELPKEDMHLAFLFAANDKTAANKYTGAPFYQAKKYLDTMIGYADSELVLLADFDLSHDDWRVQICAPYEPKRSAVIIKEGIVRGVIGEFRPSVQRALKLPAFTAGFEIAIDIIDEQRTPYISLPRFPRVEQDISLKVPADLSYGLLKTYLTQKTEELKPANTLARLTPLDIFQREEDTQHKQVAFRLSIAAYDRTLTAEAVNSLLDHMAAAAREKYGAERL